METHKILIIDDSDTDRLILKRYLLRRGITFQIDEVSTGAEGEQKLRSQSYDCVFLDYMLPDMDGIQVLKAVYDPATDLTPSPIVMMTGQGNEAVVVDALCYGAQDYLNKSSISSDTLNIAQVKAAHNFKITLDRNKALNRLLQTQKLESIGRLTGGIAHDFNNLLQIIMGNACILKRLLEDNETACKRATTILETSERGAKLTGRMLSFAREQSLNPSQINLHILLDEIRDLLAQSIGENITLKINVDVDTPSIWVDKVQLEMALINMAINARDAMDQGGTLTISAHTQKVDEHYFFYRRGRLKTGTYLEITVSDTGQGIPADFQDKIFDPFFTTKGPDKGTGLGLSMVFGFVEQSGGYINVYSEEGRGTTFKILLPEGQGESLTPQIPVNDTLPISTMIGHGTRHILVVEDNPDIRSFVWNALDTLGFRITMADTADQALVLFQEATRQGQSFDLVFSDIVVPGQLNGLQLLEHIRTLCPSQPFLMTSGHAGTAMTHKDILSLYNVRILHKPYRLETLAEELTLAMGAHHATAATG